MKVGFFYVGPLRFRGRLLKQIATLQEAGHECVLIHGWTEDECPDYSGYDFPVEPVRVFRGKSRFAERFKTLTLMVSLSRFSREAEALVRGRGAEVVLCVGLLSAWAGAYIKKRSPELRFIFDSNELFLEASSGPKKHILAVVQKEVLKRADVIIHAERRRLEYFHETYATEARPFVLENLPHFRAEIRRRGQGDFIRCLYVGGFMPGRHCEEMLRGFSELGRERVKFDMVGFYVNPSFKSRLEKVRDSIDTTGIRILPPVAHHKMYELLSGYDVGFAFYENTNLNNYYCAPNKVYDYIQMGMPVVTNDHPGLVDVVRENGIGVCLSEINGETIAGAIRAIEGGNLFANITEKVRRRFSWEHQVPGYLGLFE